MFIIIGLVCNLIATVFLFYGSQTVPWDIQTWGGSYKEEKEFKKNRQHFATIRFYYFIRWISFTINRLSCWKMIMLRK
jgi:ABC-type multidrug transport system permease subunit